jgi:hypothetical protein
MLVSVSICFLLLFYPISNIFSSTLRIGQSLLLAAATADDDGAIAGKCSYAFGVVLFNFFF